MSKKFLIAIGTFLVFIAACVVIFSLLNKKIVISFDTDGGTTVEQIEVKKGSKIELPATSKEEFKFIGWYMDNVKVSNETIFNKNVTLKAKWVREDVKTFTISFDSDGGSTVESITLECGKELTLPKSPTKKGYKFLSWVDKNGMPIYDKALLTCEDINLKASWQKEEKNTETKKETKEPIKTYTCPKGYTLSDTKCRIEATVKEKCGERGFEYDGKCVTITASSRKEGERGCPNKNITVGSYAGSEAGEMVYAGTYFCYYHKLSYSTQSQCESLSGQYGKFVWRSSNNTCYVTRTTAEMTCDNLNGYVYLSNPNTYEGVNGLNGGCYPLSNKTKYCDEEFTLTNGKCIKTIDAILK